MRLWSPLHHAFLSPEWISDSIKWSEGKWSNQDSSDPIRTHLMGRLESHQVSLPDWKLVDAKRMIWLKRFIKAPVTKEELQNLLDLESPSQLGCPSGLRSEVRGPRSEHPASHFRVVCYQAQVRTPSSSPWSAGLKREHVAQNGRRSFLKNYLFSDKI